MHRLLADPVGRQGTRTLPAQIVEQFGHHRRRIEHRVVTGITSLVDHQQAFVAGQQRIEENAAIVGARQPVAEPRRPCEQIEFAPRRGPRPGALVHAEQHHDPPRNAAQAAQGAHGDCRARHGRLRRAVQRLRQSLLEAGGIEQHRRFVGAALAQPGQGIVITLQAVTPGMVARQQLTGQPAGEIAPHCRRLLQADGRVETFERLLDAQPVQQRFARTGAHTRNGNLVADPFAGRAERRAQQQPVERSAPGVLGRPPFGRHAPACAGGIEQLEQAGDLVVVHRQRMHQHRVVQPACERGQRHAQARQRPQVQHRAQQRVCGGAAARDRHRNRPTARRRGEYRLQRGQRRVEVGATDRNLVRLEVGDFVETLEQRVVQHFGRAHQPMGGQDLQTAVRARTPCPGRIAGQEDAELQRLQAAWRRGRRRIGIGEGMVLFAQGLIDRHAALFGQIHDLHAEVALRAPPVRQHGRLAVVQPGLVGPQQCNLGTGPRCDHVVPELAAGIGREHVHVDRVGEHPEQRELFGRHRHRTEQHHPTALQAPGHRQRIGAEGRQQPIVGMDRRDARQPGQQRIPEPALPALVRRQRLAAHGPKSGLPARQPVAPVGEVATEVGRDIARQLEAVRQRRLGQPLAQRRQVVMLGQVAEQGHQSPAAQIGVERRVRRQFGEHLGQQPPQVAAGEFRPPAGAHAQALRHALLQPAGLAQRRHDDHVFGQRPARRHGQLIDQGVGESVETGFETNVERHGRRRAFGNRRGP